MPCGEGCDYHELALYLKYHNHLLSQPDPHSCSRSHFPQNTHTVQVGESDLEEHKQSRQSNRSACNQHGMAKSNRSENIYEFLQVIIKQLNIARTDI